MNQEKFQELNKKEKKEFLSNDMAERIMRVEQRVSARFGKLITYNQTEYFKSLNTAQKTSFEKYLKNKGKKKAFFSLLFLIPILLISLLNVKFTGNVVSENFGNYYFLNYILIGFMVFFLMIIIAHIKNKKSREKRIKKDIKILDNLLLKKG